MRAYGPTLEEEIVVEQAGFRQGRCTGDQVLALTTFIKNGFQKKMKTGVVFLDHGGVWHRVAHRAVAEDI